MYVENVKNKMGYESNFRNPFIYMVDPLGLEPRTDRL